MKLNADFDVSDILQRPYQQNISPTHRYAYVLRIIYDIWYTSTLAIITDLYTSQPR